MKTTLLAAALLIPTIAQADLRDQAIAGQAADVATTAIGLTQSGIIEANPLGPIIAVAVKPAIFAYVETMPEEERAFGYSLVSAAGWGASANNLCVIVGGGLGCLAVGIASGIAIWNQSVQERQFWEWCAYFRKETPELDCVWTN